MQRKVSFPNYFNPLSLAETPCGADWKREFHISIHSAIASRDMPALSRNLLLNIFQSTPLSLVETGRNFSVVIVEVISIHSTIASRDGGGFSISSRSQTFQSTPLSLAETANSHILYPITSNNHGYFAYISLTQFIQFSYLPSITAKFSVRTSQGFYDHFWFAP